MGKDKAVAERFAVDPSSSQLGRANSDGPELADRLRSTIGKRRVPELVIGLALISFGIFGSLMLRGGSTSGKPIVIANANLERGHIIGAADLTTLDVPNKVASLFVLAEEAKGIVGTRVAADVAAGMPIPRSTSSSSSPLGFGEMLSSVAVRTGGYPPLLDVGDPVLVVVVPDPTLTNGATPYVFGKAVRVFGIETSPEDPSLLIVTLRGDKELFLATSGALEIRLALIGEAIEGVAK